MIHTHPNDPPLTAGEAAKVAWLLARMAKRGIAGEDVDLRDLQRKVDRILNAARKRADKAAAAARTQSAPGRPHIRQDTGRPGPHAPHAGSR